MADLNGAALGAAIKSAVEGAWNPDNPDMDAIYAALGGAIVSHFTTSDISTSGEVTAKSGSPSTSVGLSTHTHVLGTITAPDGGS